MHRFFVPPSWIDSKRANLEGEVAHQLIRVLRMSPGDQITLLDNSGKEYKVLLTQFMKDRVQGEVTDVEEGRNELPTELHLYQGILKGDRFEWVLQKGTELGVTTFVPMNCHRSVPLPSHRVESTRSTRWKKIITEAAEQSGRSRLPKLEAPLSFKDACDTVSSSSISLIPWEEELSASIRTALQGIGGRSVDLFIGPEGGFEEQEVAYACSRGITPVTMGGRILRSETAAIVAVTAVLYESGHLGR